MNRPTGNGVLWVLRTNSCKRLRSPLGLYTCHSSLCAVRTEPSGPTNVTLGLSCGSARSGEGTTTSTGFLQQVVIVKARGTGCHSIPGIGSRLGVFRRSRPTRVAEHVAIDQTHERGDRTLLAPIPRSRLFQSDNHKFCTKMTVRPDSNSRVGMQHGHLNDLFISHGINDDPTARSFQSAFEPWGLTLTNLIHRTDSQCGFAIAVRQTAHGNAMKCRPNPLNAIDIRPIIRTRIFDIQKRVLDRETYGLRCHFIHPPLLISPPCRKLHVKYCG